MLRLNFVSVVPALAGMWLSGCKAVPVLKVQHSPVVATSSQQVTFTATVVSAGSGSVTVQLLVNAALVKTCNNLSAGGTCTHTGGPYTAYQGTTVSYAANATDSAGSKDVRGYYYFAVTDGSYKWSLNYLPARYVGAHSDKEDLVFHQANDYSSFATFVQHVGDKMYTVYSKQDIIDQSSNFDKFNFYIYPKTATSANCGTVDSGVDTDMSWRDDDAVLHTTDLQDCTNPGLNHFSAEGQSTKAFLHESGHGVFGLADEYDGCGTYYFEPATEPNIFSTDAKCRAEQQAKGRNQNACWKFTACQGGWYGIHQLSDGTVMQIGNVGNPWGTEAAEHVRWWFAQLK